MLTVRFAADIFEASFSVSLSVLVAAAPFLVSSAAPFLLLAELIEHLSEKLRSRL